VWREFDEIHRAFISAPVLARFSDGARQHNDFAALHASLTVAELWLIVVTATVLSPTGGRSFLPQCDSSTSHSPQEEPLSNFVMTSYLRTTSRLRQFPGREEGQDMIEYALLAALISIVAIAVIILIGPYLKNLFQDVVNALAGA
jgi:pilus assembly protein Flp/PilA